VSVDGGATWTSQAVFVTNALLTEEIISSLWTITLNVNMVITDSAECTFAFGNTDYRSTVMGITILTPKASGIQWFRLSRADFIGFIIGGYADIIGAEAVYVLVLFAICGSMYRRYNHFGPIAFLFAIFAGPGGLLLVFLPAWAILPAAIFLIIGLIFILWRVIR
jgi:hypothetical protein